MLVRFFALCFVFHSSLFAAGDIFFKNLGFSGDGSCFMFGEYGLGKGGYYSGIYFVDVYKNNFINPGVYTRVFNEYVDYTDTAEKGLYELLKIFNYRVKNLNINHLNKGRNIYLYAENEGITDDSLDFIDFLTGNRYRVSINKTFSDSLKSSAFTISFSVEDEGVLVKDIRGVGRENYYRKDVIDYKIRQIFLFPKEDGVVFVVEKIMLDPFGGKYGRFMVEVHKY
ncbi:DUF2259 domain-containing protein [Borrelia sp. BU AG58]|uniref:DUF2259 domain-containing protein n=1 Tax=Borrelia sp. BU AG58 TaxID=2887345 RepID=UPI001E58A0E2|nr:DUF2259 domain-containing protein [Borrelia sp. BU AG58]UER67580.1 DUF2259 domain-containing protein [Borrelia sp. BU AG58]